MTPAEQLRAEKLLALARERFCAELRPIEEQIVRHSCGFGDPEDDDPLLAWRKAVGEAPAEGTRMLGPYVGLGGRPLAGWPGPEVRAEFLRWILLDADAPALLDPKGVRVWGARVTEAVDLSRCRLKAVLEFRQCLVEKEVEMDWAELQEVTFADSTLVGLLRASGTMFRGSVFASNSGFAEIDFSAATVQGQLLFSGVQMTDRLNLDGINVTGSVLLTGEFTCDGEVSVAGAGIGGQLSLAWARLNCEWNALTLDGTRVGQSVYLNRAVIPWGKVSMAGIRVGSVVYCEESQIAWVVAEGLEAQQVMWTKIPKDHRAKLNLRMAKIGTLLVDGSSLEATSALRLNHAALQAIADRSGRLLTVDPCIAWLSRLPEDERAEAQPWMLLSRMREGAGDRRGARHLIYQLRLRQIAARWPGETMGSLLMGVLARFFARLEEQPFRILEPLAVLLVVGTTIFHGYRGHFAETGDAAYRATHTACAAGVDCAARAAYPRFSSFVYTLENVLPVVKLGQDAAWAPHTDPGSRDQGVYWVLVSLRWFLILSGWAMGIILGAAITARFRA